MNLRYKAISIVAATSIATAIVSASQASANTRSVGNSVSSSARVQRGLNVTGFDAAVAKAHGYKIVTYADGSMQSVPASSKSGLKPGPIYRPTAGKVSPNITQNTVYGNCGYSYIEGEKESTHKIWLISGFGLNSTAVAYNWRISLEDRNGTSYQGAHGSINSKSWSHEWDHLNQYSYSFDDVLTSSSATLANGSICTSGGPGIYLNGLGG